MLIGRLDCLPVLMVPASSRQASLWEPDRAVPRSAGGKVRPMPFGISLPELIILLLVLLLVFGAKRLPEMGRSLGKGMREFKDSVSGVEETFSTTTTTTTTPPPTRVELPTATSEPVRRPSGSETRSERETVS